MGKPLDDLGGLDAPTGGAQNLADTRMDATRFIQELKSLSLDDDRYGFAFDTIQGILDTVERTRTVTVGQRVAIDNIVDGATRHEEHHDRFRSMERRGYTGGRRYEGFGGKWR